MKVFFTKHGDKVLFALALVFLAAALFRSDANRPHTEAPGIVFTQWWENDLDKDILPALAEEFKALHGINVTINLASYEDVLETLRFSPEKLPQGGRVAGDVYAIDPLWLPELTGLGIIEDDFTLFSFIDVLYYNVEILKDAGFSRPPKNRSEFLDYARAIASMRGNRPRSGLGYVLGISLGENNSRGVYDDVFPWIWAAGVPLVRDGSPVVNSRQVIESLSFLAVLNSEGLIAPDAFRADNERKLGHFTSGEVAFMVAPTVYVKRVRELMGDEAFGITSIPAPDNYYGRPFLATAGWAFGIHSASERKEEARLFTDFLAGKASAFSEQMGAVPGSGAPPARDPFYSKVWDIAISSDSARDFAGLSWTEMGAVFREEIASLLADNTTPAAAAAKIQERIGILLKD